MRDDLGLRGCLLHCLELLLSELKGESVVSVSFSIDLIAGNQGIVVQCAIISDLMAHSALYANVTILFSIKLLSLLFSFRLFPLVLILHFAILRHTSPQFPIP